MLKLMSDVWCLISGKGQRSEGRGQRAEDRGQRSEVRDRRAEVRGQGSEVIRHRRASPKAGNRNKKW